MSFQDPPREPRAPRKPRARISLKMQAIGFLSRREHSRQELRAKLLDSLRKRAREEAALAQAAEKAAQALALALQELPSNGIDDAFAPAAPAGTPARPRAPCRAAPARPDASARADAEVPPRAALDTLLLGDGAALPATLRSRLDAAAAAVSSGSGSAADAAATAAPATQADEDLEHADPEAAVDQLLDWLVANKYLSESRFVESRVNARARKQGGLLIKLELSRHGLALEPDQAAALRETEFARARALWQRKFGETAGDAKGRAKQARFLAARGFASDVVRRVVGGDEEL